MRRDKRIPPQQMLTRLSELNERANKTTNEGIEDLTHTTTNDPNGPIE